MTKVKICGLTRPEDASAAVAAGAWALGVIFAPGSPRRVSISQAKEILASAPPGVERVGVFVNASLDEIVAAVRECGLSAVQLHGEESAEYAARVRHETGVAVIRAVRVAGTDSLAGVVQFDCDYILLDTYAPGSHGGTGRRFDWSLAAALPDELRRRRLILSGGIKPENIAEALESVGPYAFDVSSGIETAPGVKDPDRLRQLFDILKEKR